MVGQVKMNLENVEDQDIDIWGHVCSLSIEASPLQRTIVTHL